MSRDEGGEARGKDSMEKERGMREEGLGTSEYECGEVRDE